MVLAGDSKPVAVLSRTAHRMSLGEILAMEQKGDLDLTEEAYFLFISEKTASLISAACEIGATYAFDDEAMHDRFQAFGTELGLAYQITDDLFDYEGNSDALGKEIGSDLKEGKITLPVIRALPGAPREIQDIVARAVAERTIDRSAWKRLVGYLRETDAFDYCRNLATHYADRARSRLEGCPDGPHKDSLSLAVDFAVKRVH
jgi:octaprenyl-diphosphate synthase